MSVTRHWILLVKSGLGQIALRVRSLRRYFTENKCNNIQKKASQNLSGNKMKEVGAVPSQFLSGNRIMLSTVHFLAQ